jgi:hypothetical protein
MWRHCHQLSISTFMPFLTQNSCQSLVNLNKQHNAPDFSALTLRADMNETKRVQLLCWPQSATRVRDVMFEQTGG